LRVRLEGRQLTYGLYETEEDAFRAQARWRLTHLLPADDPELAEPLPASVAVGGVRCDEWFERWQKAKGERRSMVRLGTGRGGAASTAARDVAQWRRWWAPELGGRLPHTLTQNDVTGILRAMEAAGRAPNTIRTHWVMIRAFLNWLVSTGVLAASPVASVSLDVDAVEDRVRQIVVPDFAFLDLMAGRLGTGEDRLIFELLIGAGGRRSEVAGLLVRDVDLAAGRVWVREPVVEVEGVLVRNPTPKGGHRRGIIVGPALAVLLREHLARRGMPPADTPLFVGPRGAGLRWNNYLARRFRPAVESASVRWASGERRRLMEAGWGKPEATAHVLRQAAALRGLTPHHLRHTSNTARYQ
jgi:integrase